MEVAARIDNRQFRQAPLETAHYLVGQQAVDRQQTKPNSAGTMGKIIQIRNKQNRGAEPLDTLPY
jgi:hypothetical protein